MSKRTLIMIAVLALAVGGFGVLTAGAANQAPTPTARYQTDATAWLGVGIADADTGAVITQVIPGSPADDAGLITGDVITAVDNTAIDSAQTLIDTVQSYAPGDEITLAVERDGDSLDVTVTLGERPEVITTERVPSETRPLIRGALNILGLEAHTTDEGLEIDAIADDSPFADSGLQAGDVITALNGEPVTEMGAASLMQMLRFTSDEPISVTLLRDGKEMTIDITVDLSAVQMMPSFGTVTARPSQLGVRFQTLTPDIVESDNLPVDEGARILEVYDGTPAAEAGLQVDDVITEVDGDAVDQERTLSDRLYAYEEGDTVTLTINRGGEEMTLDVTLGPRAAQFGPLQFGPAMPMRPGDGPGMYHYYGGSDGDTMPRFRDMMPDLQQFFEAHPDLDKLFQGLEGHHDWQFDFDLTPDDTVAPAVPDTPA